jgi:hypothetical protein
MGLVAFVVEQVGGETGAAVLRVVAPSGPDPFSEAVLDLRARQALDDPSTSRMIAEHFAEVTLAAWLEREEDKAARAAAALLSVQGGPHLLVRASRLQGDIEITAIEPIQAGSDDEAEEVFSATVEKALSSRPGQ